MYYLTNPKRLMPIVIATLAILLTVITPTYAFQETQQTTQQTTQELATSSTEATDETTTSELPQTTQIVTTPVPPVSTAPVTQPEIPIIADPASDLLQNEGPTGEVPELDVPIITDVPAEGELVDGELVEGELVEGDVANNYNQAAYTAPEVLWQSVDQAKAKFDAAAKDYLKAVDEARSAKLRRKQITAEINKLTNGSKELIDRVEEVEAKIAQRALLDYAHGASQRPDSPTEYVGTFDGFPHEDLIAQIVDIELSEIDQYKRIREELEEKTGGLFERQEVLREIEETANLKAEELQIDYDQAKIEFDSFSAGSQVFVNGAVFPISIGYSYPLIDSFGFPRMPGTKDAHWHEGIDLFAPRGTPLVAAEKGVIYNIGSGRLGGLKFWLKGESGTKWYYAHLDSFAPGLVNGLQVEPGRVLGTVGTTGNAKGTPPHLHLEMHPGGGSPINPYPLLNTIATHEQKLLASGTHWTQKVTPPESTE